MLVIQALLWRLDKRESTGVRLLSIGIAFMPMSMTSRFADVQVVFIALIFTW